MLIDFGRQFCTIYIYKYLAKLSFSKKSITREFGLVIKPKFMGGKSKTVDSTANKLKFVK